MSFSPKDFYNFNVFCQIVDYGGITNAEYITNLTQPSLSAILTKIEKQLDMRLCDRGRGGFQLTQQGEAVYKETKKILAAYNTFTETLTELKGELIGQINMGCIDNLLSFQPSPITKALSYSKQYAPNIHYNFYQADIYQLERRLMDGSDQLLISVIPEDMKSPIRSIPLFKERSQLYAAMTNENTTLPVLKVINGGYSNAEISELVSDQFECKQISDQLSLDASLMHIMAGHYAVFLPTHYAEQYVDSGLIQAISPDKYYYTSQVSVSFNPKRQLNLASQFMLKSLMRYAEPDY
jgi:DNA-binding transcriptional LysR family regulator